MPELPLPVYSLCVKHLTLTHVSMHAYMFACACAGNACCRCRVPGSVCSHSAVFSVDHSLFTTIWPLMIYQ